MRSNPIGNPQPFDPEDIKKLFEENPDNTDNGVSELAEDFWSNPPTADENPLSSAAEHTFQTNQLPSSDNNVWKPDNADNGVSELAKELLLSPTTADNSGWEFDNADDSGWEFNTADNSVWDPRNSVWKLIGGFSANPSTSSDKSFPEENRPTKTCMDNTLQPAPKFTLTRPCNSPSRYYNPHLLERAEELIKASKDINDFIHKARADDTLQDLPLSRIENYYITYLLRRQKDTSQEDIASSQPSISSTDNSVWNPGNSKKKLNRKLLPNPPTPTGKSLSSTAEPKKPLSSHTLKRRANDFIPKAKMNNPLQPAPKFTLTRPCNSPLRYYNSHLLKGAEELIEASKDINDFIHKAKMDNTLQPAPKFTLTRPCNSPSRYYNSRLLKRAEELIKASKDINDFIHKAKMDNTLQSVSTSRLTICYNSYLLKRQTDTSQEDIASSQPGISATDNSVWDPNSSVSKLIREFLPNPTTPVGESLSSIAEQALSTSQADSTFEKHFFPNSQNEDKDSPREIQPSISTTDNSKQTTTVMKRKPDDNETSSYEQPHSKQAKKGLI